VCTLDILYKSSAVVEMGDRGHNRHMPKRAGLLCPLRGELGPRLIQCGLGRGLLPYQVGTVGAVPYPRRQCIFIGKDNPFPAIGDAGYRKHVGGAPSHGLRQHTHKIW